MPSVENLFGAQQEAHGDTLVEEAADSSSESNLSSGETYLKNLGIDTEASKEEAWAAIKDTDYYERLGVHRQATPEELKKAHRLLSREFHPDITKHTKTGESVVQGLNEAYETLTDPDKRRRYDEEVLQSQHNSSYSAPEETEQDTANDDAFARFQEEDEKLRQQIRREEEERTKARKDFEEIHRQHMEAEMKRQNESWEKERQVENERMNKEKAYYAGNIKLGEAFLDEISKQFEDVVRAVAAEVGKIKKTLDDVVGSLLILQTTRSTDSGGKLKNLFSFGGRNNKDELFQKQHVSIEDQLKEMAPANWHRQIIHPLEVLSGKLADGPIFVSQSGVKSGIGLFASGRMSDDVGASKAADKLEDSQRALKLKVESQIRKTERDLDDLTERRTKLRETNQKIIELKK